MIGNILGIIEHPWFLQKENKHTWLTFGISLFGILSINVYIDFSFQCLWNNPYTSSQFYVLTTFSSCCHMYMGGGSSAGIWATYQWLYPKESDSPSLVSQHLPTAPQLGSLLPMQDECWLAWSCAGNHSCCEKCCFPTVFPWPLVLTDFLYLLQCFLSLVVEDLWYRCPV